MEQKLRDPELNHGTSFLTVWWASMFADYVRWEGRTFFYLAHLSQNTNLSQHSGVPRVQGGAAVSQNVPGYFPLSQNTASTRGAGGVPEIRNALQLQKF